VLKETQFYRNTRSLAQQILGQQTAMELWGHMMRKAAGNLDIVPWHQDEAYWDPGFEYRSASFWMPLDPATEQSGCMSFIPGSHRKGVLDYGFTNDDPLITSLALKEEIDVSKAVLQPVPIGGASIHHGRSLHYSGPNTTECVRRAYVNEWHAVPQKRDVPYDRPWYWAKHKVMREYHNNKHVVPA
jgi:ectoine hydroxylase-related dioxygenase (phytanoyl-CoA dioxygenase family)